MRDWKAARRERDAVKGAVTRLHGLSEFRIFRLLRLFRGIDTLYLTRDERAGEREDERPQKRSFL
jgi:hypothetical protein